MILYCDPCRDHKHDCCARTVRAFIKPDGPSHYFCECTCNLRRRRRVDAERRITEVVTAFRREYGVEATRAVVDRLMPPVVATERAP